MEILNYENFVNESIIPVLDVVIDDNGNVYNGDKGFKLMKGHVEKSKSKINIIGEDGNYYPAGIDKNGNLVSVNSEESIALNSEGNFLLVPNHLNKDFGDYWRTDSNYEKLIPILGTGWVNVKIDLESVKRVRRYSSQLGKPKKDPIEFFKSKMKDFTHLIDIKERKRKTSTIQKEMSALILLHHLKEIKDFFTPSSSGFLLESFLAGMFPNAKVLDDNSKIDIISNNVNIQIKFYKSDSKIATQPPLKFNQTLEEWKKENSEFMILAIKFVDKIVFVILDLHPINTDSLNHYSRFLTPKNRNISIPQIIKSKDIVKYEVPILKLDEKINKISTGLKDVLDILYGELSLFQYNVETIISGVDEKGKILNDKEFIEIRNSSEKNLEKMRNQLDELLGKMKLI